MLSCARVLSAWRGRGSSIVHSLVRASERLEDRKVVDVDTRAARYSSGARGSTAVTVSESIPGADGRQRSRSPRVGYDTLIALSPGERRVRAWFDGGRITMRCLA
jgi:hypothetical protein